MQAIKEQEWKTLPEQADKSETLALSNHSANTVEQWLDESEDSVWK